jgi:ribosomal protein S18 acetylase RimI-like enzyme
MGLLRRAGLTLRNEGLTSFWFKALAMLGYRRLLVFERMLNVPLPDIASRLPLTITSLGPEEISDYTDFRGVDAAPTAAARAAAGDVCFVASFEKRIVASGWATTTAPWLDYLEAPLAFHPGDVYLYDLYTLPEYRGRGIGLAFWAAQLRHFQAAGCRRVLSTIEPENLRSVRIAAKTGGRPIFIQGRWHVGSWRRDFRRPWRGGA